MALFLKDEDVNRCLFMADMLEAIETMQRRFGQGAAYNLARRKIVAEGGEPATAQRLRIRRSRVMPPVTARLARCFFRFLRAM